MLSKTPSAMKSVETVILLMMILNAMMEIPLQEMDATQIANLKEVGIAKEVILMVPILATKCAVMV